MIEKLITRITLDTSAETKEYLVQAKQGDKATRFVSVLIVNDGQEYTPPKDAMLRVNFLKPDGHWCYNAAALEKEGENRILVELTNQALAVPGKMYAEIEIRTPDQAQILTTCKFTVEIAAGLRNEAAILSSNEMTAFDQKWETITSAETTRSQAEQNRQTAEQNRATAERGRETAVADMEKKTTAAAKKAEDAAAQSDLLLQAAATAERVDTVFAAQLDGSNTDDVFTRWWATARTSGQTMTELLGRWFDLLKDEATYGVKFYHFSQSATEQGVLLHTTAKLGRCVPGTNTVPMVNPYMNTAAFWIRDVAYEIENKDVVIKAVAGIDGVTRDDLLTGKYGMVGVAQKTGWVRHTDDGVYTIHEYRTAPAAFTADADAFRPLAEAVRVDGTLRPFVVHAKYQAGRGKDGKLTSATDLAGVNFMSMADQITEWRKRGPDYSGMSGCDNAFRMLMVWLLFGVKGNSGVLEGCTYYWLQYAAAASEQGVTRVLLPEDQARNILVGSAMSVGVKSESGSADRGNKSIHSLADMARVESITDETVGGKAYKAVNLANVTPFDTVAGTTMISSMPWRSGSCDHVMGTAGSPTSCTSRKEPFIIQGLECQTGDYMITADQLIVQKATAETHTHQIAFFREAAKISTSEATATLSENVLNLQPDVADQSWQYIEDLAIDKDGNMYPTAVGRAGSTIGARAALYVRTAGSRVTAVWAWASLYNGGIAGLPCVISSYGPWVAYWYGLVGACGSGANRGEYVGR